MMLNLIPLTTLALSTSLILITTPLTLGVWVLMISLLTTLMISTISSSWMAMAIFLIYIGGLLVLFTYFLAIQPNQTTPISTHLMMMFLSLFMFKMSTNYFLTIPLTQFNQSFLSMPFILCNHNLSLIIILSVILLLILVVVVKITYSKSGPLRPFT